MQYALLIYTEEPTEEPPAEAVDRPVPCRRRDPGARVVRDAPNRPRLERGDERFLDGLLGEVEVAEDADERRDRPARFGSEQAVDDLVRGGIGSRQSAPTASGTACACAAAKSKTGRTSIEPCLAPGIIAA